MAPDAEFQALEHYIRADKRYRRFVYVLTMAFFAFIALGALYLNASIQSKIDGLVAGSVTRNEARQAESRTISKETTRYITCIILLPIPDRTQAAQDDCFERANLEGGLERSDFQAVARDFSAGAGAAETSAALAPSRGVASPASSSSTQPAPNQPTVQSDSSQLTQSDVSAEQPENRICIPVVTPLANLIGLTT